jgi:hypothetical protein
VVAADGRTEPACTWGRSPNSRVQVVGASSMRLADIDKLTVLDRDGHVLATARLG